MRNPRTKRGFFKFCNIIALLHFLIIQLHHNITKNLPCFVHEKHVIMISNYVIFYQDKMCKQNSWELHNGIVPLSSFL